MTWPDVQELLKQTKTILVSTGSIEQHGPHLPLYSDVVAPLEVSILVAMQLGCVVAPPLRPGVSAHHMPFPGTITLQAQTFIAVVKDYARSLTSHGFDPVIFINGHGGNTAALSIATAESRNESLQRRLSVSTGGTLSRRSSARESVSTMAFTLTRRRLPGLSI